MAPGQLLQVPVLQGATAPPAEPEFHGDDTPVFWRFGFDLTARLRAEGFVTDLLCTAEWAEAVAGPEGVNPWPDFAGEFDVPGMLAAARARGDRRPGGGGRRGDPQANRRRAGLHVPDLGLPGTDPGG